LIAAPSDAGSEAPPVNAGVSSAKDVFNCWQKGVSASAAPVAGALDEDAAVLEDAAEEVAPAVLVLPPLHPATRSAATTARPKRVRTTMLFMTAR
jgi:hypothetical protein